MHSILEIKSFILPVRIGKKKEERKRPQDIGFSIRIGFQKAVVLKETKSLNLVCYQAICHQIKTLTKKKSFIWIEDLAGQVVQTLKASLPAKVKLQVCIHKSPKILKLKGGVSYTCGDLF